MPQTSDLDRVVGLLGDMVVQIESLTLNPSRAACEALLADAYFARDSAARIADGCHEEPDAEDFPVGEAYDPDKHDVEK